jgi:2-methylcitrate dehydratase PrpD
MSIHYNVAAALSTGNFEERNFEPQSNRNVLKLATLTTLEVDPELTKAFPSKQGAEVIVHTKAGDVWSERVEDVVPATADDVRERFLAAAAHALGGARAAELEKLVATLESRKSASELSRLTRAAR